MVETKRKHPKMFKEMTAEEEKEKVSEGRWFLDKLSHWGRGWVILALPITVDLPAVSAQYNRETIALPQQNNSHHL